MAEPVPAPAGEVVPAQAAAQTVASNSSSPPASSGAAASPTPSAPDRRWALRLTWRILRIPLIAYGFVVALLFFLQEWVIFPGHSWQGDKTAEVPVVPGFERIELTTAGGEKVVALFAPAAADGNRPDPDPASRPTVLHFYGNAMWLRQAVMDLHMYRRLGANVLIPEYVGYGASTGSPSEAGCRATADAAYEHLLHRKDVNPDKIVASGWSLGAAVAIDLASRKKVAGLAAFCAFSSMIDMGRNQYPYLPISLLLLHPFNNEKKIASVKCPILLGHGRRDSIIPFSMMGRLAAAAGGPVTQLVLDKADHNDFFLLDESTVHEAIRAFLEKL
ncbi:MAG: alpha/beta hydrolase [Planctomycetes bacterium]|nr:alpha/beta hydrolase [Planctomycetota bacterium]